MKEIIRIINFFFGFFVLCIVLILSSASAHADDKESWWKSIELKTKEVFEKTVEEVGGVIDTAVDSIDNKEDDDKEENTGGKPEQTSLKPAAPSYPMADVLEAQRLLKELGYNVGSIDGVYGTKTADSIRAYESDNGLPLSGTPSPGLLLHMRKSRDANQVAAISPAGSAATAQGYPPVVPGGSMTAAAPATAATSTGKPQEYPQASPIGSMSAAAPAGASISPANAATPAPESAVAPQKSTQSQTSAVEDARAAGVRLVRGLPLIQGSGWTGVSETEGIFTVDQAAAAVRFIDHIRISVNPHLARAPESGEPTSSDLHLKDRRALCVANSLLTEAEKAQVLEAANPQLGAGRARPWKGQGRDEFQVQRARDTYNEQLLPRLLSRAPGLPIQVVVVETVKLNKYETAQKAFPFAVPLELSLPKSACFHESGDYLPVANPIASSWALAPADAEAVTKRIPVDGGGAGPFVSSMSQRKVFSAITYSILAAPESPFNQQGPPRTPLRLQVEQVGLYEDPDLERQLHIYDLDQPAPAVMLAGLPDRVPARKTVLLDAEAAALLMLREQGDVLSEKAWNTLARLHAAKDKLYYDREEMTQVSGSYHKRRLETFDPGYVPFFPEGLGLAHHKELTPGQLATFKAWSLKRAAALGDEFVVTAQLFRVRAKQGGFSDENELRIGNSQSDSRYVVQQLAEEGIAVERIVRPKLTGIAAGANVDPNYLAGPEGLRSALFVFEHPLPEYVPGVTADQLAPHYQGSRQSWPALMEVTVTGMHMMPVAQDSRSNGSSEKEALVIGLRPSGISLIAGDGFQVAHREAYDMAALQAKADQVRWAESDARASELAAADAEAASLEAFKQNLESADILGIRLGMPAAEAEAALRKKLNVGWVARFDPGSSAPTAVFLPDQPYGEFKTYISADGSQQVALFYHPTVEDRLVGVTRTVMLPEAAEPEQVLAQVRKKYGNESLKNGNNLTWTLDIDTALSTGRQSKACQTDTGYLPARYLQKEDGAEFSRDERMRLDAGATTIRVRGGSTKAGLNGQETAWDSAAWEDCGPVIHVDLQQRGDRLFMKIAILDLGDYAGVYSGLIQSSKANQVIELPEL